MTAFLILIIIVLVLVTGIYYPPWRNRLILRKPLPQQWLNFIDRKVPFFNKLAEPEQQQLKDLVQLFIAKKNFMVAVDWLSMTRFVSPLQPRPACCC